MGRIAEGLHVRATVPGGLITAELRGNTVTVSFAPGGYGGQTELELQHRLERLAARLWTARMRAYFAAVSQALDEDVTAEPGPVSQRDVDYRAARAAITARGRSGDGRIAIEVFGMRDWTVDIRAGTIGVLTESEFVAAINAAAGNLILDQYRQIRDLKRTTADREAT